MIDMAPALCTVALLRSVHTKQSCLAYGGQQKQLRNNKSKQMK